MNNTFFNTQLQHIGSRIPTIKGNTHLHLDKNEQTEDVEQALKRKVLERLMQTDWNRYPSTDHSDIVQQVAQYCGLAPENIVLSAGSASMITTLLNHFALNGKDLVITQPSYSLFDYHCKTNNIPYQPWLLNSDLQYDFDTLPALTANSVLIVTAPNNPVGNTISVEMLEQLLLRNPEALIMVDGVYCEFSTADFTPLMSKYANLMILRSFSKAFPIAGLRLGYLCAAPKVAAMVQKLVLQFSLTEFSLVFAREVLFDPKFMASSKKRVRRIIAERERLFHLILQQYHHTNLEVFPSEGNFLLMRLKDEALFEKLMTALTASGIKILNTSGFALLNQTFRVSIGEPHENEQFLSCLAATLSGNPQAPHSNLFDVVHLPFQFSEQLNTTIGLN